jgi:hypothetical protein
MNGSATSARTSRTTGAHARRTWPRAAAVVAVSAVALALSGLAGATATQDVDGLRVATMATPSTTASGATPATAAALAGRVRPTKATTCGWPWPSWVSSQSGGANLRGYPWHAPFRWLPNCTSLYMYCWRNAHWAYGNYWTNRWFYVTAYVGGRYYNPTGWVHASLVANQQSVGWCPEWYVGSGG